LQAAGVRVAHADVRIAEDLNVLPAADWVIDAAAQPSVLAGTDGSGVNSRQLMQHNLEGTINVLEYCRRHRAGVALLSTSRVYSIAPLAALKMEVRDRAFRPSPNQAWPPGVSEAGVAEVCATAPPVSLYGASKVCSEALALEYGHAFQFPVWINRLGVLAGAGQFGRADQGIFSYWIHSCAQRRLLKFIGFGGEGYQVRDCLHPRDLGEVLVRQMESAPPPGGAITNFAGGNANSMSLRQLHAWCEKRFGPHAVDKETADRPFDVPWMVLDCSVAEKRFGWKPAMPLPAILDEIAAHAEANPQWLDYTNA
jgi:CDP-paratose 2-epimerase